MEYGQMTYNRIVYASPPVGGSGYETLCDMAAKLVGKLIGIKKFRKVIDKTDKKRKEIHRRINSWLKYSRKMKLINY
jgi:hypothetical protein